MALVLRRRMDSGSIAPAAILLSFALLALLAFAVDMAAAYALSVRSASNVQIAEEEAIANGSGFVLKNAEDPGRTVAEQVMESVRSQGADGAVTVWYWEAPAGWIGDAGALPEEKRLIVVGVECVEEYEPVAARAIGSGPWHVTASRVFAVVPYSEGAVWRPPSPGSGVYAIEAGADPPSMSYTPLASLSAYPEELAEEAQRQAADMEAA